MQNMDRTSVLIVDYDMTTRYELGQAVEHYEGLRLAGLCDNAQDAVAMAQSRQPDLLLLELDLPQTDGFFVLEQLNRLHLTSAVVAHSALCGETTVRRAFSMGAAYFLAKPFSTPLLLRRMKEVASGREKQPMRSTPALQPDDYALRTATLLDDLGMPPHLLGYGYFRDGIASILRNMQLMQRLTTQLYPMLARKHATTPARVERAMRHAVEVLWMRGDLAEIDRYFGDSIATDKGKPTSGEFMARLADALKLQR